MNLEERLLIESIAEPLGFHNTFTGLTGVILHDSWNKADIGSRFATLRDTLSLAGMSVTAHHSTPPEIQFSYVVIKP